MKKYLGKIITCVGIVFALVAIFMMFAPAAVSNTGVDKSFTGTDLAFGYTEESLLGEVKFLGASANILTYILLVVGVACAVVALLGKGGKIVPIVAAAAFVAAGVLFFCTVQLCMPYPEMESGEAKDKAVEKVKESLDLGAGAIVAGVFSFVAAAAAVVPVFISKK